MSTDRTDLRRPFPPTGETVLWAPPARDPRGARAIAWSVAIAAHAALLVSTFELPASPAPPEPVLATPYVLEPTPRPKPPDPTEAPRERPPEPRPAAIPVPAFEPLEPLAEPARLEPAVVELPAPDELFELPAEAPPAAEPPGLLRPGNGVSAPVPIHRVEPRYTETARRMRVEGLVVLEAIVDAEGRVTEVRVLRGLPAGLDRSAVAAVRQWRYAPATLDGRPVPVILNVSVHFDLR